MWRIAPILVAVLLALPAFAIAQTSFSASDGMTPIGLQPGTPAGSYQLSSLDAINLYNGSANVTIPLLKIGGRGDAGYTLVAQYDAHWEGFGFTSTSSSDGCSEIAPCPMWAFASGGASTGTHSYRPAGITLRRIGLHVQPIFSNGSSTPSCFTNGGTLTRISVSFADGSEMTLVDALTGGKPASPPLNVSSCGAQGFDRGTTFVSTDGSTATFIAENHVYDVNTPGTPGLLGETIAGTLYFRDGRQFHFGEHQVQGFPLPTVTVIDRIRDRNGNQTTFDYNVPVPGGFQSAFAVIDPLGRVTNIAEGGMFTFSDPSCTGDCQGSYDQITYGPPSNAKTITVYHRDYWYDRTSILQNLARPTYQDLFGGYASPATAVFSPAIWKVVFPGNHSYQFRYTQYAEVARVDLPTGGHYEFDWVNGPFTDTTEFCLANPHAGEPDNNKCPIIRAPSSVQAALGNNDFPGLLFAVYRRVQERREYSDGGAAWTRRTTHSVDELPSGQSLNDPLGQCGFSSNINFVSGYCSRVTVDNYDPDPALGLLSREIHYFYGAVSRYQSLFPQVGWFSWWLEGKEFRTDVVRPSDGQLLRKQVQTWQSRAIPAWWQTNPSMGPQPAVDARIGGTDSIIEGGKMSRRLFAYASDDTNNVVDVSEYDFGSLSGSPGQLLRRTHTDYLTNYNSPSIGVYLRNLPLLEVVYAAANTIVSQTEYGYDESIPLSNPGIVQNVAAPPQRGNQTRLSQWRNTDGLWLTTTKTYDSAGNVVSVTNPGGDSTTYAYTDCPGMYAYVTRITNALGHSTTYEHNDCTLGQITAITDSNGFQTTAQYNDVLDRLTNMSRPNGQRIGYSYSSDLKTVVTTADQYTAPDTPQQISSTVISDGLGRTIETRSGTIVTRRELDALGRVKKQYHPGSTTDGVSYAYDALGRVSTLTYGDGSVERSQWSGDTVLLTDPASKQTKHQFDAVGRLLVVTEDPSSQNPLITTYSYDALDNLTGVVQGGQIRSFIYDSLKQLRAVTNPEVGGVVTGCLGQIVSECYQYDLNGNLRVKQTGGTQLSLTYDSLNRIKRKTYDDGTPQVDFAYDTAQKGCLDSVSNSVASTLFTAYDVNCLVTASRQTVGSQNYFFTYAYNLASQLTQETYPSGRVVTYHYNVLGQPDRVGNGALSGPDSYATNIAYAPHGAIAQIRFGVTGANPGWMESWQYDAKRLQPTSVNVNNGLLGLAFSYCASGSSACTTNNGNLMRQVITRSGAAWTQDYTAYDAMNRLLSAQETSTAGTWSQSYGYDRYGNWWLANQTGSIPAPTNETPRNASWYLPNNRLTGWGYDARGNVTSVSNMARAFSYDGENHQTLASINGASSTYAYDGQGRRITKTAGGNTTTYVYDAFGKLAAEYGSTNPISGTQYLSVDHLGSTRLVTDANGTLVANGCHDYLPFGGEIIAGINGRTTCYPSTVSGEVKFTGKERDPETSLDYFGARYFSAAQARFTSPDISLFDQNAAVPQSWNLYAYVRNNPLTFIDPLGLDCIYIGDETDGGALNVSVASGKCKRKSGTYVEGTVDTESLTWDSRNRILGYSFTGCGFEICAGDIRVGLPGDELDAKGLAFVEGMAARVDASNKMIAMGMVASAVTPVTTSALVTGSTYATATAAGWYYGMTGTAGGIVLGSYNQVPNYLQAARAMGANAFNIPRLWPILNYFGQSWTANRAFLDASLFRGQQIYLSTAPLGAAGSFARELQYLTSRGFGPHTWHMLRLPY